MDIKKNKERKIFDFVYADRPIDSVTPSEEPDFKVKNADGEFGVEITECYFTHSRARLRNIPGYVKEILEENKFRHKDDIASLEAREFLVKPHDNRRPDFTMQAILQKRPQIDEYIDKVSELIAQKNKLFKNYIQGLRHVNLIISDEEHGLLGAAKDKFHHLFFRPPLERALLNADFREIYFVTKLGEFNSSKYVYVPLKMLFLVAEVFFFNYILDKEYPDIQMTAHFCAEYLAWRGAKNVYFNDNLDEFEVAYGDSGIAIVKGKSVNIEDYTDFALPAKFIPVSMSEVSPFFDNTFLSIFENYKRDSVFTMELCFEVGASNQIDSV